VLELSINKFLDLLISHFNILTNENNASFEFSQIGITFKVKRRENLIPKGVGFIVPFHNLIIDARKMLLSIFEHFGFE